MNRLTVLDGPMGTELLARGVATPLPGWSAHALDDAPDIVRAIHRDYATAGADIHTTNTFRTQRRYFPDRWRELIERAVALARAGIRDAADRDPSIDRNARVAGSVAPLADCYSPDRSPDDPRPEHREMIGALAAAGVDMLLVETFPHVDEALIATAEAVATGLPTWVSFTAGPGADLLTPTEIRTGAERAIEMGAAAVLVNCIPTDRVATFLTALRDLVLDLGVPFGAYANAGAADDLVGFTNDPIDADRYAAAARGWIAQGATIVGGCCGTDVAHVRRLRDLDAKRR